MYNNLLDIFPIYQYDDSLTLAVFHNGHQILLRHLSEIREYFREIGLAQMTSVSPTSLLLWMFMPRCRLLLVVFTVIGISAPEWIRSLTWVGSSVLHSLITVMTKIIIIT